MSSAVPQTVLMNSMETALAEQDARIATLESQVESQASYIIETEKNATALVPVPPAANNGRGSPSGDSPAVSCAFKRLHDEIAEKDVEMEALRKDFVAVKRKLSAAEREHKLKVARVLRVMRNFHLRNRRTQEDLQYLDDELITPNED